MKRITEHYNTKIYRVLNESLLLNLLRVILPKEAGYSIRELDRMRKKDPEITVQLDAIAKSHKELQRLYRTFQQRYPNSELLKNPRTRL